MSLVAANRFKKSEVLNVFRFYDFRYSDSQNYPDEPEYFRSIIDVESSADCVFNVAMIN